jgi:multimeric flavodoxin WrbA
MKKVIILNGSPRKNWNTYKMCENFANGVNDSGAEAEIINLYDVDFKGCRSCFACKLKDGKNFGRCGYPDGLTPILDKISQADGVVLASPIYFGDVTGVTRSVIERLLFPFLEYKQGMPSIAPKKLKTAVIYTMNVNEDLSNKMYQDLFGKIDMFLEIIFSKPQRICAYDTYQFPDYDKYVCETFDKNLKQKQRDEQFPKDLEKAYQAGLNMLKGLI